MSDLAVSISVPAFYLESDRSVRVVGEEFVRATEEGLAVTEAAIARRTPVGVAGALRSGTRTELRGRAGSVNVLGRVVNPVRYAPAVEDGGRPHRAPLAPVLLWVRRTITSDRRVAGAIWHAIARRGTRKQPFWIPGWRDARPRVLDGFDRARHRAIQRMRGRS